jgi:hypothetical protein
MDILNQVKSGDSQDAPNHGNTRQDTAAANGHGDMPQEAEAARDLNSDDL